MENISLNPVISNDHANLSSGLAGLKGRVMDNLRDKEDYITGDIKNALEAHSSPMQLPKSVVDQFKEWDKKFTNPEDVSKLELLKRKTIEIYRHKQEYVQYKIRSNGEKLNLEFSIKAISKAVNGIQQLLSSQ